LNGSLLPRLFAGPREQPIDSADDYSRLSLPISSIAHGIARCRFGADQQRPVGGKSIEDRSEGANISGIIGKADFWSGIQN
jgi:hypothetical protein